MDSRQQFEAKYPLPEGMYFDDMQNAYAGTKDFWLWCTRWESWQASRESLVVRLDPPHNDYENYRDSELSGACKYYEQAKKHIHSAGIRTK